MRALKCLACGAGSFPAATVPSDGAFLGGTTTTGFAFSVGDSFGGVLGAGDGVGTAFAAGSLKARIFGGRRGGVPEDLGQGPQGKEEAWRVKQQMPAEAQEDALRLQCQQAYTPGICTGDLLRASEAASLPAPAAAACRSAAGASANYMWAHCLLDKTLRSICLSRLHSSKTAHQQEPNQEPHDLARILQVKQTCKHVTRYIPKHNYGKSKGHHGNGEAIQYPSQPAATSR